MSFQGLSPTSASFSPISYFHSTPVVSEQYKCELNGAQQARLDLLLNRLISVGDQIFILGMFVDFALNNAFIPMIIGGAGQSICVEKKYSDIDVMLFPVHTFGLNNFETTFAPFFGSQMRGFRYNKVYHSFESKEFDFKCFDVEKTGRTHLFDHDAICVELSRDERGALKGFLRTVPLAEVGNARSGYEVAAHCLENKILQITGENLLKPCIRFVHHLTKGFKAASDLHLAIMKQIECDRVIFQRELQFYLEGHVVKEQAGILISNVKICIENIQPLQDTKEILTFLSTEYGEILSNTGKNVVRALCLCQEGFSLLEEGIQTPHGLYIIESKGIDVLIDALKESGELTFADMTLFYANQMKKKSSIEQKWMLDAILNGFQTKNDFDSPPLELFLVLLKSCSLDRDQYAKTLELLESLKSEEPLVLECKEKVLSDYSTLLKGFKKGDLICWSTLLQCRWPQEKLDFLAEQIKESPEEFRFLLTQRMLRNRPEGFLFSRSVSIDQLISWIQQDVSGAQDLLWDRLRKKEISCVKEELIEICAQTSLFFSELIQLVMQPRQKIEASAYKNLCIHSLSSRALMTQQTFGQLFLKLSETEQKELFIHYLGDPKTIETLSSVLVFDPLSFFTKEDYFTNTVALERFLEKRNALLSFYCRLVSSEVRNGSSFDEPFVVDILEKINCIVTGKAEKVELQKYFMQIQPSSKRAILLMLHFAKDRDDAVLLAELLGKYPFIETDCKPNEIASFDAIFKSINTSNLHFREVDKKLQEITRAITSKNIPATTVFAILKSLEVWFFKSEIECAKNHKIMTQHLSLFTKVLDLAKVGRIGLKRLLINPIDLAYFDIESEYKKTVTAILASFVQFFLFDTQSEAYVKNLIDSIKDQSIELANEPASLSICLHLFRCISASKNGDDRYLDVVEKEIQRLQVENNVEMHLDEFFVILRFLNAGHRLPPKRYVQLVQLTVEYLEGISLSDMDLFEQSLKENSLIIKTRSEVTSVTTTDFNPDDKRSYFDLLLKNATKVLIELSILDAEDWPDRLWRFVDRFSLEKEYKMKMKRLVDYYSSVQQGVDLIKKEEEFRAYMTSFVSKKELQEEILFLRSVTQALNHKITVKFARSADQAKLCLNSFKWIAQRLAICVQSNFSDQSKVDFENMDDALSAYLVMVLNGKNTPFIQAMVHQLMPEIHAIFLTWIDISVKEQNIHEEINRAELIWDMTQFYGAFGGLEYYLECRKKIYSMKGKGILFIEVAASRLKDIRPEFHVASASSILFRSKHVLLGLNPEEILGAKDDCKSFVTSINYLKEVGAPILQLEAEAVANISMWVFLACIKTLDEAIEQEEKEIYRDIYDIFWGTYTYLKDLDKLFVDMHKEKTRMFMKAFLPLTSPK